VDNAMRVMIEAAARLILQEYRTTHPEWTDDATPIDDILPWLGLEVATFDAQDHGKGTFGFMDPDEEEDLIWLCRDLEAPEKENFRRFTLAHELGHALLHCQGGRRLKQFSSQLTEYLTTKNGYHILPALSREDPCHGEDVQEDLADYQTHIHLQETLGGGYVYDPRSERELAANLFAAELLLPTERLYTLYQQEHVSATTLANRFHVSLVALLNRLYNLLTITPPEQKTAAKNTVNQTNQPATKKQYDVYQQAAIEAATPALIVAGPGSGKTSTLIGRVEYLITTLHIPPQNILALTFSRKATEEMEERLQHTYTTTARSKVSTFHAFCADILRQYGQQVGLRSDFTLIDEAEGYFILRQQANSMRLRHYQKLQAPTFYFPDMLKAISRAKDELITPEDYKALAQRMLQQAYDDEEAREKAEKALEVAQVYDLYQQGLQKRGDTDFGGLLMLTIQLLREQPTVLHTLQQTYQHILVDEFQDVNRASGILLRELAGSEQRVWVVGDANQAIYGFRGASPANISQFEQDFPGAHVLPLSRNYRSRPDLVALAEAFRCKQLELGQEPGKNQPVRLTHTDTYVTIARAADEASEINSIIQDIQHKYTQGYSYKDMVILCRTRNQVQKISRALSSAALPVIEQGGMLEQEYIKDVLSILLLLINDSGMGLLRAAREKKHLLSQRDIEMLLLAARDPKTTVRQLLRDGIAPLNMSIEGRHSLLRISDILKTLEFSPHIQNIWSLLAHYLLIETTLVRDLLTSPDDPQNKQHKAVLADYMHLLQIARHYDQQQEARHRTTAPATQADSQQNTPATKAIEQTATRSMGEQVKDFLEYLNLLVLLRQDNGNRQASEDDTSENTDIIRVMTVHASKGLEFPIVYMPGLVQRRFPSQMRTGPITAPTGMVSSDVEGSKGHESGESCLFYVGVTRARDQLVLSYSERYGKIKYKCSPYVEALEAGLTSERITKLRWDQHTGDIDQNNIDNNQPVLQLSEEFINTMRSARLSTNAIEEYLRCPRRYAYGSIYHFEGEKDGYQLFWHATQRTVKEIHEQLETQTERPMPTEQEIKELYSHYWQQLGGHMAPFSSMYEEHGYKVVEAVRRSLHSQEEVNWQLQTGYLVEVAGQQVHVRIDRVENANSTTQEPTRFVRTRFGQRKEKPAADTRELFYTLAYRQHHPENSVEVHSYNLSTGESIPITMTAKKEQNLYTEVTQAIQGLERNEYPAQPAEPHRCPSCPFFLICPT
jgi:DNA helicase II / ATP-dependent DNA helicase PcrA